ncbi:DUF6233 domain-containing protein [Streptomyces lavendulae]|uniref:DUF6233 domain-containing protein n=1 Tax=Streptomyces lavendulae TaxID=1914 RepID=UPI0036C0AAC9
MGALAPPSGTVESLPELHASVIVECTAGGIAAQGERRPAPPPPELLIERGTGRLSARVHTGQCWDTRTRCKPATTDQARRALTGGVCARPHRRPDTALGVLERTSGTKAEG